MRTYIKPIKKSEVMPYMNIFLSEEEVENNNKFKLILCKVIEFLIIISLIVFFL